MHYPFSNGTPGGDTGDGQFRLEIRGKILEKVSEFTYPCVSRELPSSETEHISRHI